MVSAAINCALGIEPYLKPTEDSQGVCIRYFCPEPGKLTKISNTKILNDKHIYQWEINRNIGDTIPKITSSLCRSGYVIVTADTPQKAIEHADKLLHEVIFETE